MFPHRKHHRCSRTAYRHDHHRMLTPPCPLAQVVREPCARWLVDFHLHRALGAYERRGHLCTLCTLALRRCLRPDEFLVLRSADPRPLALPMCLHEHVLNALRAFVLQARGGHHGRHVRLLQARMRAVFGAVWGQREPLAQKCALNLLMVSVFGRVAACILVFCPEAEPCPCRAMSVRVRGACPCRAVVNLRLCM